MPGGQVGPGGALARFRQPAQGHHLHPAEGHVRHGHGELVTQQHAEFLLHVQDRPTGHDDRRGEPAGAGLGLQMSVQNALVRDVGRSDLALAG